jgi:hypothetical protein
MTDDFRANAFARALIDGDYTAADGAAWRVRTIAATGKRLISAERTANGVLFKVQVGWHMDGEGDSATDSVCLFAGRNKVVTATWLTDFSDIGRADPRARAILDSGLDAIRQAQAADHAAWEVQRDAANARSNAVIDARHASIAADLDKFR